MGDRCLLSVALAGTIAGCTSTGTRSEVGTEIRVRASVLEAGHVDVGSAQAKDGEILRAKVPAPLRAGDQIVAASIGSPQP